MSISCEKEKVGKLVGNANESNDSTLSRYELFRDIIEKRQELVKMVKDNVPECSEKDVAISILHSFALCVRMIVLHKEGEMLINKEIA